MITNDRKVYFLFGTTGSGKSYYFNYTLISQFLHQSIIIIDSMHEYTIPKFISVFDPLDLINIFQTFRSNPHIIYKITDKNEFVKICEIASLIENTCLVIDEISRYEKYGKENEFIEAMIMQGRHLNQSVIIITQNPPDLPTQYRNNISSTFFFQMLEFRYIEYCRGILGKELSDKLITLPRGQFIRFPECLTKISIPPEPSI